MQQDDRGPLGERGWRLWERIQAAAGPEFNRHRGVDAPGRRDTAIAGGSYRAPGALVDGFRAGDSDQAVTGIVVTARASTAVLRAAQAQGANLIISRQAFLGDSQDRPVTRPEPALAAKIAFIEEHRLMVLRMQDVRSGPLGRALATAFPDAIGLPADGLRDGNLAEGLVYRAPPVTILDLVRRIKRALPTETVRLIGDPGLVVTGVAVASESNRPNALAPLVADPAVNLTICGEVHETETTPYVMDAIRLGQPKALLMVGSIAVEEPAARVLAARLQTLTAIPVAYLPSPEGLREVA